MQIFEAGRETKYLEDILSGRKTVEGRLNRGKFSQYQVGDLIYLREDLKNPIGGISEIKNRALVKVTKIEAFASFERMLSLTGVEHVLPGTESVQVGVDVYHQFYSPQDEAIYGVLAIHIELVEVNPQPHY